MTDLAKGMLRRGDRMDEAIIAYILHEALMVSGVVETVVDASSYCRITCKTAVHLPVWSSSSKFIPLLCQELFSSAASTLASITASVKVSMLSC